MAEIKSQFFKLDSHSEVVIRSAVKKDAPGILTLSQSVIEEEVFQLTSGQEYKKTPEEIERWIESYLANSNDLILVAELDSKVVGMLDFASGRRQRIAHTGAFGMSVAKYSRGNGIGTLLLTALLEWARRNPKLEKIGLSVHGNNERAIGLYKKMGFEIEGTKKNEIKYGERNYVDSVMMGLFL